MGVTKEILQAGDGKTYPKSGDNLTMHYQLSIDKYTQMFSFLCVFYWKIEKK